MEEEAIVEETDEATSIGRAGDMLRAAREAKGLSIEQIASSTRIPQRHLKAIEDGNFSTLPSRTYAIGFSRTYARTLDLDEGEVLDLVRAELAQNRVEEATPAKFEPGDPVRVPGRGLAWFVAVAALLFLGGIYAFYSSYFAPGLGPAPLKDPETELAAAKPAQQQEDASAPQPVSGPVVFTSEKDGTWVKFYDVNGERLFEAQMAAGDSFTIPADADGPQVWTGRPYALAITIDGKPVPKLSEENEVVRDVPVSAEALLARKETGAAPTAIVSAPSNGTTAPTN